MAVLIPNIRGPRHPWEDGVWIFPPEHPLAKFERREKERKDKELNPKPKELPPGDRSLP
jgi:hypothetical protein